QDATPPGAGEVTLREYLSAEITYPEPVKLGKPFTANATWKYRRVTDAASYTSQGSDSTQNIHVATSYTVDAPEIAYTYKRDRDWIITGVFEGPNGQRFRGNQL